LVLPDARVLMLFASFPCISTIPTSFYPLIFPGLRVFSASPTYLRRRKLSHEERFNEAKIASKFPIRIMGILTRFFWGIWVDKKQK
jgi:hypothetical protein